MGGSKCDPRPLCNLSAEESKVGDPAPLGPRSPNKPKGHVLGGYSTFGKSPHEPLVGPVFSFTIHRLRATTRFPVVNTQLWLGCFCSQGN